MMNKLRPIGTQFTTLVSPNMQIMTTESDDLWIADTWEIIDYEKVELLDHSTYTGEKIALVKTQKIHRDVIYCKCCGQLLE